MSLRLWPKDFERKDHITKEEKALLRNAAQNLDEGHFVVGIDPVGLSNDKVHMGFYISPQKGLLSFSIYTDAIDRSLTDAYKSYVEMAEKRIHERLLDSKALIVRDGDNKHLKFPYRHIIIFANEKPSSAVKELGGYASLGFIYPVNKRSLFRKTVNYDISSDCRIPYDPDFIEITDKECKAIFERLAPEYTVVILEKDPVDIVHSKHVPTEEDFKITGRELEYKTFFLDDYQVGLVNDMGKGHRVILANPGAGKSVLLLSKAFKYASLYKDSRVLLTCYNNNLADAYSFKRACANFGNNRNLYIMTFHKLVNKLFNECLHKRCNSYFASQEEIQECIDKVKSGEIDVRFKAIFIDEVQIFDPKYLELCYALLEKSDDATFLMAGDLNQTVRTQSRRGDAPWKKIDGVNLDYKGRVRYIERNYRNSKQVGNYINSMLRYMNKHMDELGLINTKEFDYDIFEPGDNEGIALKVQTGVDRSEIQEAVINAINEIVREYKVGYSDIAVIFPMKRNAPLKYYFLYWITKTLDEEGIPYSLITPSDTEGQKKVQYSRTSGVVITTIDSSLGLDFKAVIVAGLYPYNYCFLDNNKRVQLKTWKAISSLEKNEQEQVQINMRKMYTACSRAREILYVISDLQPESPMERLLTVAKEFNNV